jgi:transcriptional regulator with XRE-family HTH domain
MSVTEAENPLGRFLRAHREQVAPAAVGIAPGARRRTPGLRREELAMLAGISIDYLVRLEQGRDQRPSPQVLDALARVLALDEDAVAHLHALAQPAPAATRRARRRPEEVRPSLERMVMDTADRPCLIIGRRLDVLAANPLAEALTPANRAGGNLVRAVFLDPAARDAYPEWDRVAADTVASLRAGIGADVDDPQTTDLVGELSLKSDAFRRLWARQHVHAKSFGRKRFANPLVGELTLDWDALEVRASAGQLLLTYSAEPGSADERALTLLATLAR